MKTHLFSGAALTLVFLTGCGGDDITLAPDAGSDAHGGRLPDATTHETGAGDAAQDVARDAPVEAEAGPVPQRVLVTTNNSTMSELVAVDVETHKVDGTLFFPGDLGTTDAHSTLFPFLLEQANNVVARLDANRPWVIDSSWNVLGNDAIDGGFPYTDPYAAVVAASDETYVLRYNRNRIAYFNALESDDAGTPDGTIDLSSLVQAGGDGAVEMTAGVYVAKTSTLYVVLGNINQDTVAPPSYDLLCTDTTSSVIGIDTTTNMIKSLGGTAPGGGIALKGFDPVENGLVYDSAGTGRLLVLEAGCNPEVDGGPGAITKRGVEQVDLATGATTILIDTSNAFPSGEGYPSGLVYISSTSAVLGFDYTGSEVYQWNPTSSALGAPISNAPDIFTYDGAGHLLGTATTETDAGSSTNVVKVAIATGTQTVLATQPFSTPGGFIGGVDVWPHP
jgi:hypothetical protein